MARDLEVSARTIKRDLVLMRDRLGAPIEWDATSHTYCYTRPCDLLPLLWLDADEALALALASRTFAAWRGSPLGRALSSALGKIAPVVGGAVSLPSDALSELLFTPEDIAADVEHRHFARLLEAIHRRRVVQITYQKPRTNMAAESRTVHPLHLAYLDYRWVLLAHDVARGAIRTFVVARIREYKPTSTHFEPPRDFDRMKYLGGTLGRFIGNQEHTVRIAFDAEAAPYLRERPWHLSQVLSECAGGAVEATFRLNHLNDIERRVLACGVHAEVLEPAELRERVRDTVGALHRRYAEEK